MKRSRAVTPSTLSRQRLEGHLARARLDPGQFASSIRQLALDAHRVLNDPLSRRDQLEELSSRIDVLRRSSPVDWTSGMNRWLRSVEEMIDSRETFSN